MKIWLLSDLWGLGDFNIIYSIYIYIYVMHNTGLHKSSPLGSSGFFKVTPLGFESDVLVLQELQYVGPQVQSKEQGIRSR